MDKLHCMYGRDEFHILEIIEERHPIFEEKEPIIEDSILVVVADPISSQGDSESMHESIDMKSIDQEIPNEDVIKENEMFKN